MFFVIALKRAKTITFDTIISKNWAELKSPLTYSILTGLALGVYILNWTAGIFLVVVFTLFFVVQIVINHIKKTSSQHLIILSVPMMVIPTLLVIPYVEIRNGFDSAYYSLLHISVPLMAVAIVGIMYAISLKMNHMGFARIFYPVVILFVAWMGLNIISIVLPDLYSTIMGSIKMMFSARTGGQLTVAEAVPLNKETALAYFGSSYYLAFLGLLVLAYNGLVKRSEEHTLIAVWSIFILAITLAQVRFSYYYAINVAVMAAVFVSTFLDLVGWKNYNLNNLNNLSTVSSITKGIKIIPVIVLAGFIAGIFFLPAGASIYKTSTSMTKSGALSAGYFEWYFAMDWMKNNTPDTGVDYLGTYERPPKGEKYPYPDTAYGVMSWWDYGHIITYWGHRIPNANPFQASVPEVAAFLTAQSEDEGNAVMDRLGSKYVVTDSFMAYGIQTIFATWLNDKAIVDPFEGGKQNISGYYYSAIKTNTGVVQIPALKTFKSMTGRLHILDTIGLKRYRLIHETPPSPNSMNAKIGAGVDQEKQFKFIYNQLFKQNLPVGDSGYVKIFEYVKGAQITGTAPANTQVEVSLNIKTNIGRDIAYRQWVVSDSNGNFEITVPYSTVEAENGQTKFDTKATGRYNIRAKDITKEFDVDELDVLNGRIIPIDIR
jgi:dolichyl-diphosphooligosaccharide--protein glycosyltransferase